MPANTPINYSNTVVADQFMSSDFQNINAFYNDYRQGDLEFRLIKQYTNSNVSHNTVYIDNPDFYHNRYLNAEVNVDYFLQLMDDVDAFYYQLLMPDSYPTNSKLSRLKEFVSDAGCNTSLYTTSEWNQYSN